eukprot:TRINITY_DN3104_c0_g1_i1.p1 TRINITY_DN3104_c0_g1~~TRINITY_DN3104_c0_g1_i1.p1  ORF type:complete len:402 (+),score=-5.26 TRINITY_DN3104_c0_g1_i1:158-1363(+)
MTASATAVLLPAQTGEAAGRRFSHHRRHHHAANEAFCLHRRGHHPSFTHGQQHPHLIPQPPVLGEPQASSGFLPADSSPHRHQRIGPGHHHLYYHHAPSSGSHGPHGRHHHPGLASRHLNHLAVHNGSGPIPADHGFIGGSHHPVGLAHRHHSLALRHGLGPSPAGHGLLGRSHHPGGLAHGRQTLALRHGLGPSLAGHGLLSHNHHPRGLAHGHHFLAVRHGLGPSPAGHGLLRRHGAAQASLLALSVAHMGHNLERLRVHPGRSRSLSPMNTRPLLRHPRAGTVPPSLRHPTRHGMASAGHPPHLRSPTILHAGPHHQHLAMGRSAPGSIHTHGPRRPHDSESDSLHHPVPEAEGTATAAPLLMHGRRRRGMHAREVSQDASVPENPPAQQTGEPEIAN